MRYGLTPEGGEAFEVMDAITVVCNEDKDTSSLEAEVTLDEILAYMNRLAEMATKDEASKTVEKLVQLGLVYGK